MTEIDELYIKKRKKGITNRELAQHIGCSESLLSMFFSGKCNLSSEKEKLLRQYIEDTVKYKMVKIKF